MKKIFRYLRTPEYIITLLVVVNVLFILVPVDVELIDLLVGLSLSSAVFILIYSLLLTKTTRISSFPTLILILTLFRVSIEISTSRSILSNADAGDIVDTFGHYITGGSFAVGIVVFIIITCIQFIVITKGGERVAEVNARFSLDAMPGRQMSIDTDLRSGDITQEKASQLREDLQLESQMFGAMDGAMKFIKGDAIAGIIIVLVNIVGGILIGVFNHNDSFMEALRTYTILSVGAALVTQIPSLMLSLSSGIVITKVSKGTSESSTADNLASQLFCNSHAIYLSSFFIFSLGLIPGFPLLLFAVIAAVFLFIAYRKTLGVEPPDNHVIDDFSSEGFCISFSETKKDDLFKNNLFINQLKKDIEVKIFNYTGLNIDHVKFTFRAQTEDVNIYYNGIYVSSIVIPEGFNGYHICNLYERLIHKDEIKKSSSNIFVIERADGYDYLELLPIIIEKEIFYNLTYSFGIHETRKYINAAERKYTDLVSDMNRKLKPIVINQVLNYLMQEQVQISNSKVIIEALVKTSEFEQEAVALTEFVRIDVRKNILRDISDENGNIYSIILSPHVEAYVRDNIHDLPSEKQLIFGRHECEKLLANFENILDTLNPESFNSLAVIASIDIRSYFSRFLREHFPEVSVISHQEMDEKFNFINIGELSLTESENVNNQDLETDNELVDLDSFEPLPA